MYINYEIRIISLKKILIDEIDYITSLTWEKLGTDEYKNTGMVSGVIDLSGSPISTINLTKNQVIAIVEDFIAPNVESLNNKIISQIEIQKNSDKQNSSINTFFVNPPLEPNLPPEEPTIPIEITFEQKKEDKINSLPYMKDAKIAEGFLWNDEYLVDITFNSITYLNSSVLLANLGMWNNNKWKMKDGTFVTLTSEQLMAMAFAVGNYVNSLFLREEQLKLQLEAATTEEELNIEF